jgi:hypothetical protein
MKRAINQQLRETWRQHVLQQAQSGLSVAEFCVQHQLAAASFYQWKRKLSAQPAADSKRLGNGKILANVTPATHATGAFLPVTIMANRVRAAWIELTLPNGTLVRLPAENLDALQLVLQCIEQHA